MQGAGRKVGSELDLCDDASGTIWQGTWIRRERSRQGGGPGRERRIRPGTGLHPARPLLPRIRCASCDPHRRCTPRCPAVRDYGDSAGQTRGKRAPAGGYGLFVWADRAGRRRRGMGRQGTSPAGTRAGPRTGGSSNAGGLWLVLRHKLYASETAGAPAITSSRL